MAEIVVDTPIKAVAGEAQRTGEATADTLAATMMTGRERSDGGAFADELQIADGTAVGRYIVVGRIGSGGMGVVYRAYDPELDRRVALKLLRRASTDGVRSRRLLLREAQALARLSHPNVVTIYDVGEYDDQVFLAMEFIEGQTLRAWLRDESPSYERILEVLLAAGRGLVAAHDKGIIHRDFKPDNIMVDGDGRARVMDFGLARAGEGFLSLTGASASGSRDTALVPDDGMLTQGHGNQGTPAYMAPEQHLRKATDARTDQFSYCVTLYESIYGERPFAGDSLAALSWSITEGKLAPAPRGRPVPGRVQRAIVRGLQTDAADRWPQLSDLLDELQRDPRPAQRRFVLGGVVIGTLGTLAGWQYLDRAHTEAACAEEGEAIGQVWNAERGASIGAALAATEVGYAEDGWTRTTPLLDAHAAEWARRRTDACLATERDGERPPAALQRSRACLDERRARLDALLTAFETPDSAMVARVIPVFGQLLPLAECTDDTWLARRPAPADDPALREAETALRMRLQQSGASVAVGRFGDAQAVAAAVELEAEALGSVPLLAEAKITVGRSLERQGQYEEARTVLQDALVLAGGVGHDTAALDAAIHLAFVTGYDLAEHEEGLRWSRLAEMFITRLGLRDDHNVLEWLTNLGSIHQARGDYEQALLAQRRALEIAQQIFGEDHPRVAVQWTNLANAEHGHGDDAAALESNLRALAIREVTLGAAHPDVGASLLNVGVAQYGRGQREEAIESFERALAIQTAALGDHPSTAMTLNNLGAMLFSQGKIEEALARYERALQIQRRTLGEDHHDLAGSYNHIGAALSRLGRYEEALTNYERALDIRIEELGPEHPHVARVYTSMGRAYLSEGQPAEGVRAQRKALAIWEAAHGREHLAVANALQELGKALIELGEPAEAVQVLQRALEIRVANQDHAGKLARSRFTLARAMVAAGGDVDAAVALAKQAREDLDDLGDLEEVVEEVDQWLAERPKAGDGQ
ncbi:MAG: serine/threonine-protein kinase [Nannocystaceae bacterium]